MRPSSINTKKVALRITRNATSQNLKLGVLNSKSYLPLRIRSLDQLQPVRK